MKACISLLLVTLIFSVVSLVAQEKKETGKEAPSMTMPAPLTDNEFFKWMLGEWEGTGTSPVGKSREWQRVEWGLGNQFVMTHYTSRAIEMSEQQKKVAAEMMHMSKEEVEKMKDMTYEGMGPMTMNPATGELVGFWFDNWRGMYKGTGKLDGNVLTMSWEGSTGGEVRTIEKVGGNKMVITAKEKSPTGGVFESRTEMTRK